MRMAIVLFVTVLAARLHGQITSNPIPAPIEKKGLSVEVKDLVRLPDTSGLRPADQDVTPAGWARVSFVKDLPDGRRFANDSRGLLYLLNGGNQPSVYADVGAVFPFAVYNRLESGFIGFAFHPEFARNGLFYTVHSERAEGNPKTPDHIPIGYGVKDVSYHNIITEWHATNPAAATFEGTRRELLREAHVVANLTHPMGTAEFNPMAKPGDADLACSTRAAAIMGSAMAADRTRAIPLRHSASIRSRRHTAHRSAQLSVTRGQRTGRLHDSDGQQVRLGRRPETLGEIYAYGFRNAHRISWDLTDRTMFA
jgi:hypothetical protein